MYESKNGDIMQRMRFFIILFFGLVLVFLISQIFVLVEQKQSYLEQSEESFTKANALEAENKSLKKDLEYYQDDENLSKEVRAQFNYRAIGEELLILVPGKQED